MGRDATIYIPKTFKKNEILEYINFLGYKLSYKDCYYYCPKEKYRYFSGIMLVISKSKESNIGYEIWVRTQAFASSYDVLFQNETLKKFRNHFKCNFVSDYGKNRYFYNPLNYTEGAENGCFLAYEKTHSLFAYLYIFLNQQTYNESLENLPIPVMISPSSMCANISLSYICSILEDFFRNTYCAVLSEKNYYKEKLYKDNKLTYDEFIEIHHDNITLDEILSRKLNFQNIDKIITNFKNLEKDLDFNSFFKTNKNKKKESYYDLLKRIFEQRHANIHRLNFNPIYKCEDLEKDLKDVENILKEIYMYICKMKKWKPQI